ncbi:MAG TPA: hypothetical protein H9992_05095, partial [Candidatus Prevotella intestinigallinarum]|nr:hypothetical protein [Candidatus Prevotella intestinigallinarum]
MIAKITLLAENTKENGSFYQNGCALSPTQHCHAATMACGVNAIKPQYSKNKIWPAGFHFIIKKLFITTIIANFAQIIIKG